ncbi:TPM domain-containing protein [Neisseriaceae bacterium CLB008]|nr:TPM domain-containing protein [Neisseriaceae bacterium]
MNKIMRWCRHLVTPTWRVRQLFPETLLREIEAGISASEQQHQGQLRFVIESSFNAAAIFSGMTPRERALEWFGSLRVWDTEHNSGVLVYISMADHAIEVIADRGINRQVDPQAWAEVCALIQAKFAQKAYADGLTEGLAAINALLLAHLPRDTPLVNELADEVVLK